MSISADNPAPNPMPELVSSPTVPTVLTLRFYGDPVLQHPARRVERIDRQLRQLAADMIATMHQADGIGLAAPQVGHSLRLIVIDLPDLESNDARDSAARLLYQHMPAALVNPRIAARSEFTETCEEGCLSLPGIYAPVERPQSIMLQAELLDGTTLQAECTGLLGRCLQHEIDHLDGITFDARLEKETAAPLRRDLKQLRLKTIKQMKQES